MCLTLTPSGLRHFALLRGKPQRVPIKMFKVLNNNGTTCYKDAPWSVGINIAEGEPTLTAPCFDLGAGAIHLCRTERAAKRIVRDARRHRKIVPAYVFPRDILAVGGFNYADDSVGASIAYGSRKAALADRINRGL